MKGANTNALYGAVDLAKRQTVPLCEGILDVLLARPEADRLVVAVIPSGASVVLSSRWSAEFTRCYAIPLVYDRDVANGKGVRPFLMLSSRFYALSVPSGKDVVNCYLQDVDICDWSADALAELALFERQPHVP